MYKEYFATRHEVRKQENQFKKYKNNQYLKRLLENKQSTLSSSRHSM